MAEKYDSGGNPSTTGESKFSATNPNVDRGGTIKEGGVDGAGELCQNYPNPYGYDANKGGPNYSKERGRRG